MVPKRSRQNSSEASSITLPGAKPMIMYNGPVPGPAPDLGVVYVNLNRHTERNGLVAEPLLKRDQGSIRIIVDALDECGERVTIQTAPSFEIRS